MAPAARFAASSMAVALAVSTGAKYPPELRDLFSIPGQPRTRRVFTRDAAGRVDGFVDRREGEDVRWRRSSK